MNPYLCTLLLVVLFPGHATLVIASHNWCYGRLIGRRVTDFVQLLHLALLLLLPVYFLPHLWAFLPGGDLMGKTYIGAAIFGWVVLVLVTVSRNLRKEPPEVIRRGQEILSPAVRLGYSGGGRGMRGWLANLSGNEVLKPLINFTELHVVNLPSGLDGLKILHLSDLHFRGTPTREWFRVVLADCARHDPDLIVLTGDIVDGLEYHRWVGGTLGRFSSKTVRIGILGNHDTWFEPGELLKTLQRHDFQMVGGREKVMPLKNVPVRFLGSERPWRKSTFPAQAVETGVFTIALCHSPDEVNWAIGAGANLVFAGHVHGGQVRLPIVGPIIMPSRHGRRYDKGWFKVGKGLMHVSCGLGASQPVRWGCPPEAALITLKVG